MAICPECNAKIDQMAIICSECGWDFPQQEPDPETGLSEGWAYSSFANIALELGKIASLLACAGALFVFVAALIKFQWLGAGASLIAFTLSFANFVVFVRVSTK